MRRLGAFDTRARRPSGAGAARGPSGAGAPASGSHEEFDFGDMGGLGGLGDIFSSIFGRGRKGEDARGETLETTLEMPFRTAVLGGKVTVSMPITDACPACGGTGGAKGATIATCDECHGRGTVTFGQGGFAVSRPCPKCRGRGRIPSKPCPTAMARGRSAPSAR